MKYTEQDLKDEHEQAVKRKGELYAEGYIEGLKDSQSKGLTTPVDVENKELPVYEVVFNEGTDDGVTSINLTKTPLFNDFVKTQREQLKAYAKLLQTKYVYQFFNEAVEESIDEFLSLEQTKPT
jgi:hypothetical protein